MNTKSISNALLNALKGNPPATNYSFNPLAWTTIRPDQLLQTTMYYDALQNTPTVLVDPDVINQRLDYCLTLIAMSVQRELNVGTLIRTKQGIQPCDKHDFLSTLARQIKRIAYAILDVFAKICMQPTPPPLDEVLSSVFSNHDTNRPYYERQATKLCLLLSQRYVFTYTIPTHLQTIRTTYDKDIGIQMARYQDAQNDHADDQDITSAGRRFKDGIRNLKQRTTSFFGATPELGDRVVNGLNAFSRAARRAGEDAMSKVKKYAIDLNHQDTIRSITQEAVAAQQAILDQQIQAVGITRSAPVPNPLAGMRRQSLFSKGTTVATGIFRRYHP